MVGRGRWMLPVRTLQMFVPLQGLGYLVGDQTKPGDETAGHQVRQTEHGHLLVHCERGLSKNKKVLEKVLKTEGGHHLVQ